MSDQPVDSAFRSAYQALLDEARQAPDWEDLAVPVYRPAKPGPKPLPRWAGALILTTILLGAVGGVAWLFSGSRDEPAPTDSMPVATQPAVTEPQTVTSTLAAASVAPGTSAPPVVDGVPQAHELWPSAVTVTANSALDGFPPAALLDRDLETSWQDDSRRGDGAELTFTFAEPVQLAGIMIMNLDHEERFLRNYRVAEYEIVIDGNTEAPILGSLIDARGELAIPIERLVHSLVFRVTGVHDAEPFENSPPFEELAIAEVRFFGYDGITEVPPASTAGLVEGFRRAPVELDLGDEAVVTDVEWTGAFYYLSGSEGGRAALWRSRDGTVWELGEIPAVRDEVIVDLSTHSDIVIAVTAQTNTIEGGDGGIWRSTDGDRWQRVTTVAGHIGEPVEYAPGQLVAPIRGSFINPGPGLFISRNNGGSWPHLDFEAETVTERTVIIDLASHSGRTIAVGRSGDSLATLWYAGDPEAQWNRVANDPELRRFERLDAAAASPGQFLIAGIIDGGAAVGYSPDALDWTAEVVSHSAIAQNAQRIDVQGMTATENGLVLVWGSAQTSDGFSGLMWASANGGDWLVFDLGPVLPAGVHVAVSDRHVAVVTAAPNGSIGWRIADR